jgi:hypothetical protein
MSTRVRNTYRIRMGDVMNDRRLRIAMAKSSA